MSAARYRYGTLAVGWRAVNNLRETWMSFPLLTVVPSTV